MGVVIPVEIARMITGYVEDKKTFLNLLVTTHAFRLLAEPYLYTDVSFFGANHVQLKEPPDAELLAMGRSFLQGIAAGWGRCAHYVKRLYLPGAVLLRRELYKLFQTILQAVPNLEDLQVHCSLGIASPRGFNLQTLFESPPLFQLQGFGWYTPGHLDGVGLYWFLSHQTSLERLFLPSLKISESSFSTPSLPRLRILHALNSIAARRLLAGNRVTHLKLERGDFHELADNILRTVVVCVPRFAVFRSLSTAVARMPNLECLEIVTFAQSIPRTLARLGIFKSATKLRHLRILTREAITGRPHPMPTPWDYGDVVIAFNSLLFLTHISVQIAPVTSFLECYCFVRGDPQPVKLRSQRLTPEWWHDNWIENCVAVPFETGDRRLGYTNEPFDVLSA